MPGKDTKLCSERSVSGSSFSSIWIHDAVCISITSIGHEVYMSTVYSSHNDHKADKVLSLSEVAAILSGLQLYD